MDAHARAGIDIHGSVLRYAEVEQYGSRCRLLRLGSCVFDFDLSAEVFRTASPEHLETVAEALGDVFAGSVASELHVALHPPGGYAFFAPLPEALPEAEREERLRDEAAFLIGTGEALRVEPTPVYTEPVDGSVVAWFHVLAIPEWVHARLEQAFHALPRVHYRLVRSMQAAANTIDRIERREPADRSRAPFSLAVGWYETHTEFTLCRNHRWYFSHHAAVGSPADSAYFAAMLLRRLRLAPSDVGRLFLYGSDVDPAQFSLLQTLFPVAPERLNPLQLVDLDPGSLTASFDTEAYVPCIGATL
jgi:hypothetical protein